MSPDLPSLKVEVLKPLAILPSELVPLIVNNSEAFTLIFPDDCNP